MPELSQDAIRELRQSLPLLERLLHQFNEYTDSPSPPPPDDIEALVRASDRVRALTSPEQFKIWVGGKIGYSTDEEDKDFGGDRHWS